MKTTYKIINENNFQKWCDKHNLKPIEVYRRLKEKWPSLQLQAQTVRFWYTGVRNIDLKNAPFLKELSDGELTIEDLLYTPKRVKQINKILNSEVSKEGSTSEDCPPEIAAQAGLK